jgi:flagellar hook-basal body complex protein FliE
MTGINPVTASTFLPIQPASVGTPTARVDGGSQFGDAITGAIQSVSDAERQADHLAVAVASGEETSVSDLMIATSKATLSVELMAQVRNRAVEAYQEIMRMQV